MRRELLEDLLAEFVERRERGEAVDVEDFVRGHAGAGEALRSALHALLEQEALLTRHEEEAPRAIGAYRIEAEVGRGGGGRVFRAVHIERPDERCALKVLSLGARCDVRALERFRREGEALARLAHPDIVRVRAAEVIEGTPLLVLEWVEGASLAQVIHAARARTQGNGGRPWEALALPQGPVGEREIAALVARLARAIDVVHRAGLLHRDLKPSNVVLRADGSPVLIDFGLAVGDVDETLTATGDVLGTPAYLAPEQARGERCDVRADVFGLGAILHELLTLRAPREGGEALAVLERARREPIAPPRRLARGVSRALEHALRRALSFRRDRRYPSAAALAEVLEHCAAGRRSPRATLSWSARLEESLRRHRRVAVLAIASIVIGLLVWSLAAGVAARRAERVEAAERAVVRARFRADPRELERAALALFELEPESALAYAFAAARTSGSGEAASAAGGATAVALHEAEVASRGSDVEGAVSAAERLLALDPSASLAAGLLGLALVRRGDYERALRELTAAVRAVPDGALLHAAIGEVHRREKRHAESALAFRAAIDLDDGQGSWWFELARALAQSGQPEEGLRAIERANALAGAEPPHVYLRTHAALLDQLGREEEALPFLRRLTVAQPSMQSFYTLGRVLDGLCCLGEARDAYEAARAHDGKHIATLAALANLYSGSNRAECERCRAAFGADPALFDPERAERCALDYLEADRGSYGSAQHFAAYLRRIERTEAFRAAVAAALREDHPEEALGRLLRAQRVLDGAAVSEHR